MITQKEFYQDQDIISFEKLVADLINSGASTRKVAIAWLQDADPYYEDIGFMEYDYNLPRGYLS